MRKKDGRWRWWCVRYEEATCYNEFGWNHQKLSSKLEKSNILRFKLRKTSENNFIHINSSRSIVVEGAIFITVPSMQYIQCNLDHALKVGDRVLLLLSISTATTTILNLKLDFSCSRINDAWIEKYIIVCLTNVLLTLYFLIHNQITT